VLTSLLSGRNVFVWLAVGAVVVSNIVRRKTGWLPFVIALIAASALLGVVRKWTS
jgi:hypothetical protein